MKNREMKNSMSEMIFMVVTVLVATAMSVLSGCATAPKEGPGPLQAVPAERPDFVIRDRYPAKQPEWALDFEVFKKANDGKGVSYFLGESGDTNDRVAGCDLARLSAKRRVAEQIAELVMSRIGSARTGVLLVDKDSQSPSGLGSDFQELIATESVAFLTGVQEYGNSWEERDYSVSGGKKRVYLCAAVVTIDDTHLREAIRRTGKQVGAALSDPAAKSLVDAAFEKLDQGFGKAVKNDEPIVGSEPHLEAGSAPKTTTQAMRKEAEAKPVPQGLGASRVKAENNNDALE